MISARGPGVAAYQSPDGNVRVDIYMGLKLDGLKLYKNISTVKMKFAVAPNITCPPDVLIFNPRTHSTITLQVAISYWLYFTHGHWYKKILAPLSFSQRAVFTSLRMLFFTVGDLFLLYVYRVKFIIADEVKIIQNH